jgi:hypothetical protein
MWQQQSYSSVAMTESTICVAAADPFKGQWQHSKYNEFKSV